MLHKTISEISSANAGAAGVLRRLKIDLCDEGERRLRDVLGERAMDAAVVLEDLQAAQSSARDDAPATPQALIPFILETYHAVHRREVPELYKLARKVEAVHASHEAAPVGLADFLAALLGELEDHMSKEEQVLFPTLLSGGGGCAPFAIRRMRLEHEGHEQQLAELSARTNAFTPPVNACGSWRALYAGCAKLRDDLRAHIELENTILFPMFEGAG